MCHCKCSIKIHVKIYKCNVRNLVRIWNVLSLSIPCNRQVLLTYSMLNLFFMNSNYCIWNFFIAFIWLYIIYNRLFVVHSLLYIVNCILYIVYYIEYIIYYMQYIIYNLLIQIQCINIVFLFNSNVLFKYNE
jgi:hypothetical protein